ncbi:MAG: cysteine hydrolase family protein [Gammaproteobacteria bacterium]|jgi:nicotinamidase-related amidase
MNKYTKPQFDSSALITIDTQNDFTLDNAPVFISGTIEVIPNMVRLLAIYRALQWPIIHVVRLYLGDGSNAELCRREVIETGTQIVAPESDGAELVEGIKPDKSVRLNADELLSGSFQKIGHNEFIMYKPRWGAFYQTGLETFLTERNINTLVFTGCNYPNCPRTSIYEASERDYRIVLVKDAISKFYEEGENEMRDIDVALLTTNQLEQNLTNS